MKDTILKFAKSKTLWAILVFQLIAVEPYIPLIKETLPDELKYLATIILPISILWAKIIRDKKLLDEVNSNNDVEDIAKDVVKDVVKKKVVKKISKKLEGK